MDLVAADAEVPTDECIFKIRNCAVSSTDIENCLSSSSDEKVKNEVDNDKLNLNVSGIHTNELNEVGGGIFRSSVLPKTDFTGVPSTCSTQCNQENVQFPIQKFSMETNTFAEINGLEKNELSDGRDSVSSNEKESDRVDMVEENIVKDDTRDEFIPTIVDIRGSCTNDLDREISDLEKTAPSSDLFSNEPTERSTCESESPKINIVRVQGNLNRIDCENPRNNGRIERENSEKLNATVIHSVDEDSDSAVEESRKHSYNTDVVIKEEPRDSTVDNGSSIGNAECGSTCFTSEIFIEDEKVAPVQNGDADVYCLEPTRKIPSPIPIKTESLVEKEKPSVAPVSRRPLVNSCRKRTSKRRSSKDKDCYVVSSGSEREDSSDSREKLTRKKKNCAFSPADYTCHLCNTAFQEHELLNEHMILHRNNSLIEAKAQGKPKAKTKNFTCDTCNKRLSTWQSLQQHIMIHNNEKPYVCRVCKKDFRHLSNYKMHLQKHKEEEQKRSQDAQKPDEKQQHLDKSVVRGVDFGRLVGPLFMKETLLNQKKERLSTATKNAPSPPDRSSYSYPRFRHESLQLPKKNNDEAGKAIAADDVVPLKSFNRIENIVMNAARFIVKLDNVDANVLKRKIKTPDISIERGVEKRRRIVSLSPLAKNRRLDEIENIVIADTDDPVVTSDADDGDRIDGVGNDRDDDDPLSSKSALADSSVGAHRETLTDNELLELLNDEELAEKQEKVTNPRKCGASNWMLSNETSAYDNGHDVNLEKVDSSLGLFEIDDENDWLTEDQFDGAFHKLVLRRLAWLCKRAAENDGKLERRFLLGPRFWRKAIRRVESSLNFKNVPTNETHSLSSPSLTETKRSDVNGGKRTVDDDSNRTSDPVTLQSRAECKLNCVLNKMKVIGNADGLDLLGPLFWRRTLKLAGVRRGEDLKMHLNDADPTSLSSQFAAIIFVDDYCSTSTKCRSSVKPTDSFPSPAAQGDESQPTSNFLDGILNNELLPCIEKRSSSTDEKAIQSGNDTAPTLTDENECSSKFDSILYESLTKPRHRCSTNSSKATIMMTTTQSVVDSNPTLPEDEQSDDSKSSTRLNEPCDNNVEQPVVTQSTTPILNVDGQDFQLLAQSLNNDKGLVAAETSNYVLLADETGAMQYVVNMQSEGGFANFELINDPSNGQLAYAIQLDDSGGGDPTVSTANQFVPVQIALDDTKLKPKMLASGEEAANDVDSRQEFLLAKTINSSNHVGKELSDFLNLHYVDAGEKGETGVSSM